MLRKGLVLFSGSCLGLVKTCPIATWRLQGQHEILKSLSLQAQPHRPVHIEEDFIDQPFIVFLLSLDLSIARAPNRIQDLLEPDRCRIASEHKRSSSAKEEEVSPH